MTRLLLPLTLVVALTMPATNAHGDTGSRHRCDSAHIIDCYSSLAWQKRRIENLENAVVWQKHERAHDAEQRIRDARNGGSWPGYDVATIMVAAHSLHADYLAPLLLRVGRCESFPVEQQNHGGSPYYGWFQLGGHFLNDPLIRLLGWRSDIAQSLVAAAWARTHGWSAWASSYNCHHVA